METLELKNAISEEEMQWRLGLGSVGSACLTVWALGSTSAPHTDE